MSFENDPLFRTPRRLFLPVDVMRRLGYHLKGYASVVMKDSRSFSGTAGAVISDENNRAVRFMAERIALKHTISIDRATVIADGINVKRRKQLWESLAWFTPHTEDY